MSTFPSDVPEPSPAAFAPTHWTLVLRARGASPAAQSALATLCESYYAPVLAFIRREGRDEETARDLTQEFFTRLLAGHGLDTVDPARGRFRSFLLGAVKHFLADQRDRANAVKRGAGQPVMSLDVNTGATTAKLQVPDPGAQTPDTVFDRQWALTIVAHSLAALAGESKAAGKPELFDALKPWLVGEVPSLSQTEAARQLGLTEGAIKVAIHRLRRRFRELVKSEIANTVGDVAQAEDELRYLVEVLCV